MKKVLVVLAAVGALLAGSATAEATPYPIPFKCTTFSTTCDGYASADEAKWMATVTWNLVNKQAVAAGAPYRNSVAWRINSSALMMNEYAWGTFVWRTLVDFDIEPDGRWWYVWENPYCDPDCSLKQVADAKAQARAAR